MWTNLVVLLCCITLLVLFYQSLIRIRAQETTSHSLTHLTNFYVQLLGTEPPSRALALALSKGSYNKTGVVVLDGERRVLCHNLELFRDGAHWDTSMSTMLQTVREQLQAHKSVHSLTLPCPNGELKQRMVACHESAFGWIVCVQLS